MLSMMPPVSRSAYGSKSKRSSLIIAARSLALRANMVNCNRNRPRPLVVVRLRERGLLTRWYAIAGRTALPIVSGNTRAGFVPIRSVSADVFFIKATIVVSAVDIVNSVNSMGTQYVVIKFSFFSTILNNRKALHRLNIIRMQRF